MLTIEFLGSGDAFASGGQFHSCCLLRSGGAAALVDCGASAPVALARRGISPADVGTVLLTHVHGDHAGGVPFLLLDAAFNRPRETPLIVGGPAGVERAVMDVHEGLFPGTAARVREAVDCRFVELRPREEAEVGGLRVTPYPVRHTSHLVSNALRIVMADRVVAFSSDTEWHPHLVEASRDADLFVCECTAYAGELAGHLSLEVLRSHASELTATRVVLNHLGREMRRRASEAPWPCAHDGLVLEI